MLLERRGVVRHNLWMRLWRGTGDPPAYPTALRIERIGPERAATFGAIVAEAFRLPPAMEAWNAATVGLDGWQPASISRTPDD